MLPFQGLLLWSDLQKSLTDTGLTPSPARWDVQINPTLSVIALTCSLPYRIIIKRFCLLVKVFSFSAMSLKMSTLNSTFFHVFIVLPFCTIRSLFYCIFSLLGSAIVRLPLLPASHAPYFRSYASCFTSSSNSSPAE